MTLTDYIRSITGEEGKERNGSVWFHSPLRNTENTPSFQANDTIGKCGKWHDWGTGECGDLIDIIMRIEKVDYLTAKSRLSSSCPCPETTLPVKKEKSYRIDSIRHNVLVEYAHERCVSADVLYRYCVELQEGSYYYIAMRNIDGGYAIRNKYVKGARGVQNFSFFTGNRTSSVIVFEGMFDMLSLLSIKMQHSDIIVLNSTANVGKLLQTGLLNAFSCIHLYLDNDNAGDDATMQIQRTYTHAIDHRHAYRDYNDVNEFICCTHIAQQ